MYKEKYKIILADCPWAYSRDMGKNSNNGGITYDTLSKEDLGNLPIKDITANDCALFMWGTWPKIEEAQYVIKQWGFDLKTVAFVWVKINPTGEIIEYNKESHFSISKSDLKKITVDGKIDVKEFNNLAKELKEKDLTLKKGIYSGMGNWTNANSEFVLFAKKGTPHRLEKDVKQIIIAPRGRHSAKPKEIHDRIIKIIGDVSRLEIFGREQVKGWDVIGNEIEGKLDIKVSLANIIKNLPKEVVKEKKKSKVLA